ncbi:18265_t:CDS:2, partial [Entrophospora sp. SA101]
IDGWSSPKGYSIYNFMITTADNKEYLYSLCDLSDVSHTAKILRDEIERVLSRIGPNKFAAVVSDNASAILSARKQISKNILHFEYQLYSTLCEFDNKRYHEVGALLRKYIDEYGIKSGELHLYTPTRWTSMFETTNSIYERHKDLLTNDKVKHILGLRGFFHDVGLVTSVLLPLQKAILNLEGTNVNLADFINNRWESFEIHPYLLVYFLHPLYRGVGLKSTIWPNLTKYAGEIFWNMNKKNHSNNKVAELIGQMANFKCSGVFSIQYSSSYTRPRTWWQVIDDSNEYVKKDESMEESSEEVFDFDAIPEISPPSNM